jgi:hypothetical protein
MYIHTYMYYMHVEHIRTDITQIFAYVHVSYAYKGTYKKTLLIYSVAANETLKAFNELRQAVFHCFFLNFFATPDLCKELDQLQRLSESLVSASAAALREIFHAVTLFGDVCSI